MQDNIQVIADALVAKLQSISSERSISYDNLKPSLCGDAQFDRALKYARCNNEIVSRVHDGELWFRGLGR